MAFGEWTLAKGKWPPSPLTALSKDRKWAREQLLPVLEPRSSLAITTPAFPSRCVLPWAEFQSLLCACHPVEPGPTMQALRSTLDLTCSGHISVFEFDIFTRLFQVRGGQGWALDLAPWA